MFGIEWKEKRNSPSVGEPSQKRKQQFIMFSFLAPTFWLNTEIWRFQAEQNVNKLAITRWKQQIENEFYTQEFEI